MKTFWFEMGLIFGTNQIKNVFVDTYRSSWIFKYHLDVKKVPSLDSILNKQP